MFDGQCVIFFDYEFEIQLIKLRLAYEIFFLKKNIGRGIDHV